MIAGVEDNLGPVYPMSESPPLDYNWDNDSTANTASVIPGCIDGSCLFYPDVGGGEGRVTVFPLIFNDWTDQTLSMWGKFNTTTQGDTVWTSQSSLPDTSFQGQIRNGPTFKISYYDETGPSDVTVSVPTVSGWIHIVGVINGTQGKGELWWNGAKLSEWALDGGDADADRNTKFGTHPTSDTDNNLDGAIDCVQWYSVALDNATIQILYGSGTPSCGPYAISETDPPNIQNAICTSCESGTNDSVSKIPTINVTVTDTTGVTGVCIGNNSGWNYATCVTQGGLGTAGAGNTWVTTLPSNQSLTQPGIAQPLYWWGNDTLGNAHTTQNLTASITLLDSCTYTSGDWNVDCSDNCMIESGVSIDGNDLFLDGTGVFTVDANIDNAKNIFIEDTCELVIGAGEITIEN